MSDGDSDDDLDSHLPQYVDRTPTPTCSDLHCSDFWMDAMWQLAYGQTNVSGKHTFLHIARTKQRLRRVQTAPGRMQTAPEIDGAGAADGCAGNGRKRTAVAAEQEPPIALEKQTAVAAKQEPPKR